MRNDYPGYLIHYGVKGMKWGVRKDDYHISSTQRLSLPGKTSGNKSSSDGPFEASYRVTRETTYKSSKLKNGKYGDSSSKSQPDHTMTDTVKKYAEKLKKAAASKDKSKEEKANKEIKKTVDKGRDWFAQNIKSGKDKPKVSAAEKVTSTSEKGVNDLVKLRNLRDTHKSDRKADKSLANISTEDLRKIVTNAKERAALEADYKKYVEGSISKGRTRTTESLETLGAVLAVAGSAVTIISTVKSFGKNRDDD